MAYPSRLVSGSSRETVSYVPMRLRKDPSSGRVSSHSTDINLAISVKANILVVGSERPVANLISSLVNPDVTVWCGDIELRLPPTTSELTTVILLDVGALKRDDQSKLAGWLDAVKGRLQVISTASAPLLPLVESGAFDEGLYYRLNTVYIDLLQ